MGWLWLKTWQNNFPVIFFIHRLSGGIGTRGCFPENDVDGCVLVRLFHNWGQKTKIKIETGSQWIIVTLNEVEVCPKFQIDRTSGTLSTGPVCLDIMRYSLSAPRGVVGAANTSRLAATGRESGNNTCECFIESSFNAYLRVMFLQDRRTPVT